MLRPRTHSVSLVLQAVDPAHHWYYILEMGFYVSLLLSVSVDVKRKVSVSHITLSFIKWFNSRELFINTNETSYSVFLMVFFSRLNVMRIIGWIIGCYFRLCLLGLFKSEGL